MRLTPNQSFEHTKEALVGYLETAYKISERGVYAERAKMLREKGTVAQSPFVEATPAFPIARKLADLELAYPDVIPSGISDLVRHGVPVDRFNLWTHQEKALLAAFSDQPNLLVATGTGSGKTEAFLLPILADILGEARNWTTPTGPLERGEYDDKRGTWLHSRRNENRPAALRAIVLYPMNALVNDQLSRLRRILARNNSPEWQYNNLNGNLIHFGMYTSLTPIAGHWSEPWRRKNIKDYLREIDTDWRNLSNELQQSGSWPRPDSPEMLVRWDMQHAPPDILVTNYSMLEYMLVRPIDDPIFRITRDWLSEDDDARITLVVDEAHTYTGAKGTEVAHLIRRLKERLGLDAGTGKFRAIATTASLPTGKDNELREFVSGLFDEDKDRFTLIKLEGTEPPDPYRNPSQKNFRAFIDFHNHFSLDDPLPAIEKLATDLGLNPIDSAVDPQISLHRLLHNQEDVHWIRQRTARRATPVDQLADEAWGTLGDFSEREQATSGVLAAGSFARAEALADTPPLISMRLHAFFRGVPGIWACMNPQCPCVEEQFRTANRPVGKLYLNPRPWCDCGARVLELFSCRKCGLLFLGGIPDNHENSLWPWSDDLSGDLQELSNYRIFGVERPHAHATPDYRSVKTTLPIHKNDPTARSVFEVEPAREGDQVISYFPSQCPRCSTYRAPGNSGREIIEPLRTKGPRSFAMIIEDSYRVQPRSSSQPPNYGRKSLLFTDSRQEAATLAADLREIHHSDLFRQLLYRALYNCPSCSGTGKIEQRGQFVIGQAQAVSTVSCPECNGSGFTNNPKPLPFSELQDRVISLQLERAINPTNGAIPDFFDLAASGDPAVLERARKAFNAALRRELAEEEFGLEPLGLASWRVPLPDVTGTFQPLTEPETRSFIRIVMRILATEDILLPPNPYKPWEWTPDVSEYDRCVMIPGKARDGNVIPYNLTNRRKLGRYVLAIADALQHDGRMNSDTDKDNWIAGLYWELWNALGRHGFRLMDYAGKKIRDKNPMGIRIDTFELHPLGNLVEECMSCGYVMSDALLHVCARCGQTTALLSPERLENFYRKTALYSIDNADYDDPYPLRTIEHTAQINTTDARNEERWFQDLFREGQHPDDHRVDILSVTTTMEMGIDIGSLLNVGLRNVPPTVANYQQRAGRAGRRGSAISTVMTFAQFRSHDQYYFDRPPEIVSDPPRVPALYLGNEVIARRHVRSLVLQDFFFRTTAVNGNGKGLFSAWGTVSDFRTRNTASHMQQYLAINRTSLRVRARNIVDSGFSNRIDAWIDEIVQEVQREVNRSNDQADLLAVLITAGLLPKYAFPVDVVSLAIPTSGNNRFDYESSTLDDRMQRDLKIALAEYAPGAEVIKGDFPNTFIYKVAGVYDPFEQHPNYRPTGLMVECQDCQAVDLVGVNDPEPDLCPVCGSFNIMILPYLRPPGFTVDQARPDNGRRRYQFGGRERAGYVAPTRLRVGETSFHAGTSQAPFAPNLYATLRIGDLFVANKGPDRNFPGFLICPDCGRHFAIEEDISPHTFPADVPPEFGKRRGPRAGHNCSNQSRIWNPVILGHEFHSEVILLGTDLPDSMDAPFLQASGKAIWYSFGTLLKNAATVVLQVSSDELAVGVRPINRGAGRLHGEVFLYDDVPGGAGYARAISANLEEILFKALELGETCPNPDCAGACYHCLFDYRNQYLHPLLDRTLGASVLRYLLKGEVPKTDPKRVETAVRMLEEYARDAWQIEPARTLEGRNLSCILSKRKGQPFGLHVIHPALTRSPMSTVEADQAILRLHGIKVATYTTFDLERRPFWVLNSLV